VDTQPGHICHPSPFPQTAHPNPTEMSDPTPKTTSHQPTTTLLLPSPSIQANGPFSTISSPHLTAGAYMGIGVCIIVLILWVSRYSFLASNHWWPACKRRGGFPSTAKDDTGPRRRVLLPGNSSSSDEETQTATPTHPPPTLSKNTLPLYKPSSRFSSDVVLALQGLGSAEGGKPPSYRSKLSGDIFASAVTGV
jgi:hypothetical protein